MDVWQKTKNLLSKIDSIHSKIIIKRHLMKTGESVENLRVRGEIFLHLHGRLILGSNITICSGDNACIPMTSKIFVKEDALLMIGDDVGMSSINIHVFEKVIIGSGTMIGAGTVIFDTDFHFLDPIIRHSKDDADLAKTKPVNIGRNCFIGCNTIIKKGTIIGDNSIVSAGSVVSGTIPPNEIWAGNPAIFIKKL